MELAGFECLEIKVETDRRVFAETSIIGKIRTIWKGAAFEKEMARHTGNV